MHCFNVFLTTYVFCVFTYQVYEKLYKILKRPSAIFAKNYYNLKLIKYRLHIHEMRSLITTQNSGTNWISSLLQNNKNRFHDHSQLQYRVENSLFTKNSRLQCFGIIQKLFSYWTLYCRV